jgi:pentatricopeptide repeat protein
MIHHISLAVHNPLHAAAVLDGYLKTMQPENLKAILEEMISSHHSLNTAQL